MVFIKYGNVWVTSFPNGPEENFLPLRNDGQTDLVAFELHEFADPKWLRGLLFERKKTDIRMFGYSVI